MIWLSTEMMQSTPMSKEAKKYCNDTVTTIAGQ